MRSILSALLLFLAVSQSANAQMSCAEELLACTNGCVAGGLLGALATRGNSAAATATQSCSMDCESRNAACTRREDEAAIRQQRIDAERAAVEARRQAAEQRQREIAAQQNEQMLARQRETDQVVDRIMTRAAKELNALKSFIAGNSTTINAKPPSEPKPAAVLAAAKQLEDTDPLMARKLYLQLSERKDEFGKAAANALRRFRDAPGESGRETTYLGAPPGIIASFIPKSTRDKLAAIRIESPDAVSSNVKYIPEDSSKPASTREVRSIGDGYIFVGTESDSYSVSILGGLVDVVSYRSSSIGDTKRTLRDLTSKGNPFLFEKGNEFSYTYSYNFHLKSKQGKPSISTPETYHADCITTANNEEFASILCKRKNLLSWDGQRRDDLPAHIATYAYIHKIKLFSIIKEFEIPPNKPNKIWDSYEIKILSD